MYPSGELTRLATRKAVLQARIAVSRWQCVAAGAELAGGLATVDRFIGQWRKWAPFVKMLRAPLGLLVMRFFWKRLRKPRQQPPPPPVKRPRKSTLSTVLSTLPLIVRGARLLMQLRAGRSATSSAR